MLPVDKRKSARPHCSFNVDHRLAKPFSTGPPGNDTGDSPGQPGRQDPPWTPRLPSTAPRLSPDREWVWIVPTHTMLSVVAKWNLLLRKRSLSALHIQARTAPLLPDHVPRRPAERASTEPLHSIPSHHVRIARLPPPTRVTTRLERPNRLFIYKSGERSATANPCALETLVPGRRTMQTRSI